MNRVRTAAWDNPRSGPDPAIRPHERAPDAFAEPGQPLGRAESATAALMDAPVLLWSAAPALAGAGVMPVWVVADGYGVGISRSRLWR